MDTQFHPIESNTTSDAVTDRSRDETLLRGAAARAYVAEPSRVLASLVRTTFGPRSADKLIATEDHQGQPQVVVSNDAATIIDAIDRGGGFDHPLVDVFLETLDSMQRGIDDGTTTSLLLTNFLLRRGLELVERGVHPGTVALGYSLASGRTGEVLDELARPVRPDRAETLRAVARTAMTADFDAERIDRYASLVAAAVGRLDEHGDAEWLDADEAKVVAARSAERDRLREGIVVRQWARGNETMDTEYGPDAEFDQTPDIPDAVGDAGVAIVDREIDFEETATPLGENSVGGSTGVTVESVDALEEYHEGLQETIAAQCARLADLGVDVLVSQPSIDDEIRRAMRTHGVHVVDDVQTPKNDVHRLARLTDATVVSRLEDVAPDHVGTVDSVRQRAVGSEKWTTFERADGPGSTLVLDVDNEASAALHEAVVEDALNVTALALMDDQILPGAGAGALAAANELASFSTGLDGKTQLAVDAFADALEELVFVLAENGGRDPIDVLTSARAAHANAETNPVPVGVDVATGEPMDALEAGVVEPRRVFSQAVEAAKANAERLLTADAVYAAGDRLPEFDFEAQGTEEQSLESLE